MAATAGQDRSEARRAGGRRPRPRTLLWVLAGLTVAALVIGAVAGALREPAPLDADSPEGVVQAYLQAVLDGDIAEARGYLSGEAAADCTAGAYRQAWVPESLTASLDEVEVSDGEAEVRVRLRTMAGPEPFGDAGYTSVETFDLTTQDGPWRITGEPWPVFECRGLR